ncbi:hypothetical protein BT69DRAFT_1331723 [Atractiella rhizophila]|nr:hypothetical protein BT69DRAFT_1331723 [Atractiella rhizophila]
MPTTSSPSAHSTPHVTQSSSEDSEHDSESTEESGRESGDGGADMETCARGKDRTLNVPETATTVRFALTASTALIPSATRIGNESSAVAAKKQEEVSQDRSKSESNKRYLK